MYFSHSSMSSRSPVAVQQSRQAADSSSHTSPSSADTPSDSTVQSVGAVNADTSDKDSSSFTVEFKDSQRYTYSRAVFLFLYAKCL